MTYPSKITLLVILLAIAFLPNPARASLTLKIELENRLQERAAAILAPLDPYAHVTVRIELKKFKAELPGTGGESVESEFSSTANSLSEADINSVHLTVTSRDDLTLEQLKSAAGPMILESIPFPTGKKKIEFQKMSQETLLLLDKQIQGKEKILQNAQVQIREQTQSQEKTATWLAELLGAGFLILIFYLIWRDRSQRQLLDRAVHVLSEKMESTSSGSGVSALAPSPSLTSGTTPQRIQSEAESDLGRDHLRAMTSSSLIALLSDCYWCELDPYANWIWLQLSPEQQESILKEWPTSSEYITSVSLTSPVSANYHRHPYYLHPIPMAELSQEDLAAWIQKTPGLWAQLPKMRQERISLPLSDRLRFSQAKRISLVPSPPVGSGKKRELASDLDVGNLSLEDEETLFSDPGLLPAGARNKAMTLAWVALLPKAQRAEVLSKLSAQDLASAWIAPPSILEKLKEVIPEKKLKLLQELLPQITPSRQSDTMKYLVEEALKSLAKTQENQHASGSRSAA